MSQQPPQSSQEYASPPSNQLRCDSADDKLIVRRPPMTYQDKQIEEIISEFTPFNTKDHLEGPFQAESQSDDQFIYDQSLQFLEFGLDVWARNMARIRSTTQAESNRLGELLGAVIDSERQQGMSTPLILSESARPSRTVSQSSTDFLAALCRSIEGFLLQFRSLVSSLRGV
ncbi:hypothetical protein AGABI2DRAFT_120147 [Agaricus bisporus var. bisporus H97]|uniref:hypothetical protein n=1 Tax=Agaricus bisporus var. bisporus (strain H97 / ATCC MYA-4626 / FGSC 10389) TaxID=936046 RepID=UPI00029F6B4B|nr:hypothetical protein AGABI2DRAFT_120147 [Agaricus bisporus var. bisporus H97]EKV45179.1 hypothetical protein AGABI2DRAFT_120147 [Agaricus bisporus var. bisporus H97]